MHASQVNKLEQLNTCILYTYNAQMLHNATSTLADNNTSVSESRKAVSTSNNLSTLATIV